MQSLSLNNNKRHIAMDGYFPDTLNSDIVQLPVAFEPAKKSLTACSAIVNFLQFFGLFK